ncbi:MAG: hypothetical protein EAZ07_06515 [Cytophagales bacterium]|nr:MAG: hypothetical protein EAZ07_06515 [Cytophagales bacterium]
MSIKIKICFFWIMYIYSTCFAKAQLKDNFLNPPIDARPKALWTWVNGNYNYPQIKTELELAKRIGMGGFDIWDVGTISTSKPAHIGGEFLGEPSADAIGFAITEAGKLGLEIGLITSSSWNSGGKWIDNENACKGIFKTDTIITGGKTIDLRLPLPEIPKGLEAMTSEFFKFNYQPLIKDLFVVANNLKTKSKIDLTAKVSKEGILHWEVPSGEWKLTRLAMATTGELLKVPSPKSLGLMLDHFSASAQEVNLNYILGKLSQRLGNNMGKTALKYLYVDSYEVSGSKWSPDFLSEFYNRRGYDALPFLPAIFDSTYISVDSLARFKYDLSKTFSDMIIENHYLKGVRMCNKHGIGYAAEAAGPGAPVHNCPFESIKSSGVLNYARGEFWLNNDKDTLASGDYKLDMIKGVASAVHVYGKKYVEAEAFTTASIYDEDFNVMKKNLDNAFTWGLNRVVFHTFQHNPSEAGAPGYNYPFGVVFGSFQPWLKVSKGFNDYIARTSYLLQQGNFIADVLVYYGDQAPNFVKEHTLSRLVGDGYDFDAINSEQIIKNLSFNDGRLRLPNGQSYQLMLIPEESVISLDVLRKLELLLASGAVVIAKKPLAVPSLFDLNHQNTQMQNIANKIWRNIDGFNIKQLNFGKGTIVYGKSVKQVLAEQIVPKDFYTNSSSDSKLIRYIHRGTTNGEDIYFISNQGDSAIRFDASFRIINKQAELWNSLTGEIKKINEMIVGRSHTTIPLELPIGGSVFIVFKDKIDLKNSDKLVSQIDRDNQTIFPFNSKNNTTMNINGTYTLKTKNSTIESYTLKNSWVDISKNWEIRFPRNMVQKPYNSLDSLTSWTMSANQDIKYFSGEATYYKTFTLEEQDLKNASSIALEIDSIHKMAEVWLNGRNLGNLWVHPYTIEVLQTLRAGENNLVIAVSNGLNNRMVGDGIENHDRPYTYSNIDKGECAWCKPWKEVALHPSGITGKVKIRITKKLRSKI